MRRVTIRLRAADFADQMIEMRRWLDQQMPEPAGFTYRYKEIGEDVQLSVDFYKDQYADTFEGRFGGRQSKRNVFIPDSYRPAGVEASDTMGQACWWRLVAEEVRTEADGFRSESAKEMMEIAARGWEQLAKELERRLAKTS